MLSKVSKRAQRRSAQDFSATTRERAPKVDRPPDLIRWCDFSEPFPPVSQGGYARYYAAAGPSVEEGPKYSPLLSHYSDKTSLRDTPRQKPLFYTSKEPTRALAAIRESSMESMLTKRTPSLAMSTSPPNSLRRRHRQLLRTPSIERDFAMYGRLFLSSTASIPTTASEVATSRVPLASSHSQAPSSHSSSASSESEHSEFNLTDHPELPVTPSTSVGSHDALQDSVYDKMPCEDDLEDEHVERPDSRSSFSTAKSGFSDA